LSKEEVIVAYPFIEAIAVQRMAHELYLERVALIPRLMTEWVIAARGWTCTLARRLARISLSSLHRTVIGETSVIGITSRCIKVSVWWRGPWLAARLSGLQATPKR